MVKPDALQDWLEATLNRYEKPLLSYAWGLCANREEARDAVQDTFLKLARNAASVNRDKIASWLFTVCKNRIMDSFRKDRRIRFVDDSAMEQEPSEVSPPGVDLERKETRARVAELMRALPEQQRELLRLKFQAGLSYKQIAEITQLTTGNIGYIIHMAISSLRQSWREEEAR